MSNGPLYAMGGAHPNALDQDASAMRGLATGNREGKPDKREQQIYTPWDIIEVCHETWPEGICLDPCSGPDSLIPSAVSYRGYKIDTGRKDKDGRAVTRWGGSGLIAPWAMRTYVNPPYEDLEDWLYKSTIEHKHGNTEQILLFPVRPNRMWWSEYMSTIPSSVAWLRPLQFVGFDSGFPAPLVLVHTGAFADNMHGAESDATYGLDTTLRFREAVKHLSTYVGGPLS